MGNSNNLIYLILALITGALIPIQAATNTAFSKSIGNAYITGLVVFSIGLLATLIFVLISRQPMPAISKLVGAPGFSYAGGLIVAIYVLMITIITPKIGVANAIGLIVTGQILCAVIIDHFGLFNTAVRTISIPRIVGIVLMIAGIYLVMRKSTTT